MINDAISAALETADPPTIAYTRFLIATLELCVLTREDQRPPQRPVWRWRRNMGSQFGF
jgi:hypothetical protein